MSKRIRLADDQNSSTDGDDSVSDHSSIPSDIDDIQVNFQARCITSNDYHGIRRLLQQLFPKSSLDLSSLTDVITKQLTIGSVLKLSLDSEEDNNGDCDNGDCDNGDKNNGDGDKSDGNDGDGDKDTGDGNNGDKDTGDGDSEGGDDNNGDNGDGGCLEQADNNDDDDDDIEEDVLGVTTLLQVPPLLTKNKDCCITELVDYLLLQLKEYCNDNNTCKIFNDILCNKSSTTGIIIHERFLNIPMDIGPPMLETTLEEVNEQFKGEEPDYYILITRSHMDEQDKGRKRKKAGLAKEVWSTKAELVIEFEEIDCLKMDSIVSFNYPVPSECDTIQGGGWGYDDTPCIPYRTVFIIEKDKLHNGVTKLLDMFKVKPNS